MALAEKLYALRKKGGLSQEQLAEQLGVSRQAVSKWESGRAVPESETLLAISDYFHVTLDELMKDGEAAASAEDTKVAENRPAADVGRGKRICGIAVCVGGIVGLIVWGLVSIFLPAASERIGESSMIALDGNGIFLILCLAAVLAGAVLLLKSTAKK